MENFKRFFDKSYSITDKGEIRQSNGHKFSVTEVFKKFRDAQENAGNVVEITEEDVANYVKENTPERVISVEECDDFTLRDLINDYLNKFAHSKSGEGKLWNIGPAWKTIERVRYGIPVPSDISELQTAIRVYAIDKGYTKMAKMDDIKALLNDMSSQAQETRISIIANDIKFDPDTVEIAKLVLQKLHAFWHIEQSFEIFYTLMRHWMWQVKRKLIGFDTVWTLWINFFGGTAIGKTSFCNAFSKPFGDFALTTSISKLLDEERQMLKLTSSYIINLDELSINNNAESGVEKESKLGRDQQATLKALLTQTKMQTRIMGGQKQTTRRLTFSCISSANEHLYDKIYDENTMRRYFEFDCNVDKIQVFTEMDEIKKHIYDLWRSVDETLEDGYWNPKCPLWGEIDKIQSTYYPTNTTTGLWINECNVVGCEQEQSETGDLYTEYKTFCKEKGHLAKSYTNWITDIRHLIKDSAHAKHTYIRIKSSDEAE